MQYLLLIHSDESSYAALGPDEGRALSAAYDDFTRSIVASGEFVGGNALQSTATATTVRVQDGDVLTTDGPYAETKEALGGYYLVECADLDAAIALAARIPGATGGAIEIRPIMERPTDGGPG